MRNADNSPLWINSRILTLKRSHLKYTVEFTSKAGSNSTPSDFTTATSGGETLDESFVQNQQIDLFTDLHSLYLSLIFRDDYELILFL